MKKAKSKAHHVKKQSEKFHPLSANVKVIGIGGGGGNAVARMAKDFTRGVDFIAINTDHQDLDECDVKTKLYIGKSLTRGLGTGMNPDLGRQAAEENRSEISEAVQGADLVFLAAGLGGGTGTGAAPIVAEAAVVGTPDARKGEVPVAFARLRDGATASPTALADYCAAHLVAYKRPRSVTLMDAIPKTPANKICRKTLAGLAAEQQPPGENE